MHERPGREETGGDWKNEQTGYILFLVHFCIQEALFPNKSFGSYAYDLLLRRKTLLCCLNSMIIEVGSHIVQVYIDPPSHFVGHRRCLSFCRILQVTNYLPTHDVSPL